MDKCCSGEQNCRVCGARKVIDSLMKPPSSKTGVLSHRQDIEALRGIAVLVVVVFHAFPDFLPAGFIGVDVFFVISGFLITNIIFSGISQNNFSLVDFYARRVRRLLPCILLVSTTTTIAGWFVLFPDEFRQLGVHLFKSSIFLQNFQLISEQGYFDVESHFKPLLHFWSLSVEEQYYLIWPILLISTAIRSRVLVLVFVIGLASFGINLHYLNNSDSVGFFHTAGRIWELAVGSALAILSHERRVMVAGKFRSYVIFGSGVALLIIALIITPESHYPGWYGLMPTMGAGFIIIARLEISNWLGLASLGRISYPLYLWHWVLLSFSEIYTGGRLSLSFLILLLCFSVILSLWTHHRVEKIRYSESRLVVPGLLVGLLLTGLLGKTIAYADGYPERVHLDYLTQENLEFVRTPATDSLCKTYVGNLIDKERLFYYCRSELGDERDLVAVIGDSHAHMLFPGVAAQAHKNGYGTVLYANSSCPPLKGFLWGTNADERATCQKSIEQIFSAIIKDVRVKKVIIATRGPVYLHGEVQGEINEKSVLLSLESKAFPETLSYERYFAGYHNLLETLSNAKHVTEIYYLLENPELDFVPKDVVTRPFDRWGLSVQKNTVDRNLYRVRMREYQRGIMLVSADFDKATALSVEKHFCKDVTCFSYANGNFLYVDDDHLSVYGSKYLLDKLSPLIFGKEQH